MLEITRFNCIVPTVLKCWNRQAFANSVDPDQMPQCVASNQSLHFLPYIQQYFRHING